MNYILEIEENENGDLYLTFPDELVEELGWEEGDLLNWDLKGDGVYLSKISDSSLYELEEDE